MSIELREWLQRVDKARGIPERSGGTWSKGWMVLGAGDSARRVWWMRHDVGRLQVYVGAARAGIREARD
jgi:hypothetical protein